MKAASAERKELEDQQIEQKLKQEQLNQAKADIETRKSEIEMQKKEQQEELLRAKAEIEEQKKQAQAEIESQKSSHLVMFERQFLAKIKEVER